MTELAKFSIKPDKQTLWDHSVKINDDPYSRGVYVYAARWANLMEEGMATGQKLGDIAKGTRHAADVEGITGFMYGCAISILSEAWEHGEELRRWSNLDLQIGDEGEKANESGGVLNPALLNVKEKEDDAS